MYLRLALRGCAQMCFQSNALTGVLFLAAIAVVSPIAAVYTLVAALMAPAGRMLLGERGLVLRTGLPGLNPCLLAASLPAFFATGWTDVGMWGVLICSVFGAIVLVHGLAAVAPFPIVALPFLVIFWFLWAIEPYTEVLQPLDLATLPTEGFGVFTAILRSLGEAVFSPTVLSGALFLCGVLIGAWRHAIIALVGASIGTLVAYYYSHADPATVELGLYGFNGVLAGVGGYILCGGKLRLAILGSVLATILTPLMSKFGVPSLSAPFVVATWLLLILGRIETTWMKPPADLTGAQHDQTRHTHRSL
ncbi:MAG: urea transporter [Acuticoccus sp.]